MTRHLMELTTDDLVAGFASIGVEQDKSLLHGDTAKFNKLFEQMRLVSEELRGRRGDQRRALLALFDHPNIQVRLKAAKHSLAVAPIEARRQIEEIARSGHFPQAGEAGMSLDNLDSGFFKPV
ncbi:MAG: DUF2019 domain-containing protein [Hyphomicrobiales bacterium]|nr:MAG: DUF2019 domain-containing protein [Hyphomicrobiales bacterium]